MMGIEGGWYWERLVMMLMRSFLESVKNNT